jgi:hypothetical protein
VNVTCPKKPSNVMAGLVPAITAVGSRRLSSRVVVAEVW